MITLDFETEAIEGNPLIHPPFPVGVAVKEDSMASLYYVGYDMEQKVKEVWAGSEPVVFHNAAFDQSVAEHWFDVKPMEWDRVHDTLYLIYLHDPHSKDLGLKPSAERILGMPPAERDELKEWILDNVKKATKKNWGAHICKAPVHLVSKYACMDVDMTYELFMALYDNVPYEAYCVERELAPYLVNATRHGIRVNRPGLGQALDGAVSAQAAVLAQIQASLQAPLLNPNSGPELADALDKAGKIRKWKLTPTGRRSTARDALMEGINDPQLLELLVYHSAMKTCIGTFLKPWLEKSVEDGRLHPNWNQVRSMEGKRKGTRTGRLSSDDPNFQNVPNPFELAVPAGLVAMPSMKDFVLPEEGHIWVSRDFSSQEMRIMAHFEQGALAEAFNKDPDLDPHQMVLELIKEKTGKTLKRKYVKNIGFGIMYGMGGKALAAQLGVSYVEAVNMQDAYLQAMPGVQKLQATTKQRGRNGKPVTTWGGRPYHAEKGGLVNGAWRSYEYKLLNYLIQGSAADQTKRCLLHYFKNKSRDEVFMATVHDEINTSVPNEMPLICSLEDSMEHCTFGVPMRSTVDVGTTWGDAIT